jgi:hypothetical protein
MRNHRFPETPCIICSQPLDLRTDLSADENGKAVHQDCYVKRITSSSRNLASTEIAD